MRNRTVTAGAISSVLVLLAYGVLSHLWVFVGVATLTILSARTAWVAGNEENAATILVIFGAFSLVCWTANALLILPGAVVASFLYMAVQYQRASNRGGNPPV